MFRDSNVSLQLIWQCSGSSLSITRTWNNATSTDDISLPVCAVRLLLTIVPVLMVICTVFGNLVVIFAVFKHAKLRERQTSVLIGNLAVADLLVGLIGMPLAIVQLVTGNRWIFVRVLCRAWISLDLIGCTASITTLCVISLDRLIGVTRPLHYARLITRKRLMLANAGVWVFSLLTLIVTFRWEISEREVLLCSVDKELSQVVLSTVCSFYLPALVIFAVYIKIYRVARNRHHIEANLVRPPERSSSEDSAARDWNASSIIRRFSKRPKRSKSETRRKSSVANDECSSNEDTRLHRNRASNQSCPSSRQKHSDSICATGLRVHYGGGGGLDTDKKKKLQSSIVRQQKTTKTLGIVVGCFFACWLPFFAVQLINGMSPEMIPPWLMDVCAWLGYGNSACNPVIYALAMRPFRDALNDAYRRLNCCRVHVDAQATTTTALLCHAGADRGRASKTPRVVVTKSSLSKTRSQSYIMTNTYANDLNRNGCGASSQLTADWRPVERRTMSISNRILLSVQEETSSALVNCDENECEQSVVLVNPIDHETHSSMIDYSVRTSDLWVFSAEHFLEGKATLV